MTINIYQEESMILTGLLFFCSHLAKQKKTQSLLAGLALGSLFLSYHTQKRNITNRGFS